MVEELAAVDASAVVIVDVQNTLVLNALLRWASDKQKRRYLPRLTKDTVGAYALSEAGAGSDAFALATRAVEQGGDYVLTAASYGSRMATKPASFSWSRTPIPKRDIGASLASWSNAISPAFQ